MIHIVLCDGCNMKLLTCGCDTGPRAEHKCFDCQVREMVHREKMEQAKNRLLAENSK